MKKLVSLMVSFMMLINPIAGVLAEGESTQAPETQTVMVNASEGEAAEKTVEAIEVTGSGDQFGAVVNGNAAPATLTVENDIKTTSEDGKAGAANVFAAGNQGSADLSAGQVTAETKAEGGEVVGVLLESKGEESKAAANVSDVSAVSTDGVAIAVSAQAYEEKNTAEATTGGVSAEGKDGAAGIYAVAGADDSSTSDTAGSGNTVAVNTGNVTATSEEGVAEAIIAEANGSQNETTVKAGEVTAKGGNATAVTASAHNDAESTGENKTTVTTENIAAVSAEGNATAIEANAQGNKNTADVTAGDISATSNDMATGISATSESGISMSGEKTGSDNAAVVNAGNIHAAVTDNGKSDESYSYGYATGIDGRSSGQGNTVEVTAKNITAEAMTTNNGQANAFATGVSVDSYSGGKQETSTGNIEAKASSKSESDDQLPYTQSNSNAVGVNSVVSGEGSEGNTSTGSITAEATATGGSTSIATAKGVKEYSNNGKQTLTTGDIEVKATSKSEYDSQRNSEFSSSEVTGIESYANGKESEVTITTGSVTAQATADGGIVMNSEYSSYHTNAEGSAVSLTANNAGNISYTADGDVVLSLTQNMKERDAEETPASVSPSPYTYEEDAGTFTGTNNAGLKISVVGKESEVAAVIKGNVNADSTINRPDVDEPITGSDVAGVVIGDQKIGVPLSSRKAYDEDGNLVRETDENGNTTYYTDGKITQTYNDQTGVRTFYREDGTKHYEEDYALNKIYYDENGNVTNKIGDLMVIPPQASETGTANVKIEGDITSNGVALEVVPTLSGGSVNVVVEGTIKGESGAVLVNDNVNAGNFNLTVWKIDPATYHEYDDNGEVANTEESYLEVMTPEGEGYRNDTDAAEELLKQVQYIIKVDPNLSNAHVDLDGTTKFTDFTGEEYDVAHEDDKVVIKISADSGYQITGAFNGEGKEETLLRDSEGNYYIVVPRGGGVYLTATVEAINQGSPEEERGGKTAPTRLRVNDKENDGGLVALDKTESNNRVAIPAVNRLIKSEERKMLAALSPSQQLLVVLIKAGFSNAASASGFTLSEEAKKLLDSLDVNLREAVRIIYSYENGVKVKWYYLEMNLPGNKIGRFGFRQLEDGSWTVKML